MPARVARVRHRGAVGDLLLVRHRQRVQVGPQSHHRPFGLSFCSDRCPRSGRFPWAGSSAAGPPRPAGARSAGWPGAPVRQLGLGVHVAAEVDQLSFVRGQERAEIGAQGSFGIRHLPRGGPNRSLGELRDQRVNHVRQPPACCPPPQPAAARRRRPVRAPRRDTSSSPWRSPAAARPAAAPMNSSYSSSRSRRG